MLDSSLIIKIWRSSALHVLGQKLGQGLVAVWSGSRLQGLLWADWVPWREGSCLCRVIVAAAGWAQGAVATLQRRLAPVGDNSTVVALAKSGWRGPVPWFAIGLTGGVGLAWLVGGFTRSPLWLLLGGAALVKALGLVWLWPRRRVVWPDSLVGRLWFALTAMDT